MIAYFGDTTRESAASYLIGILHRAGMSFRYTASDDPPPDECLSTDTSLFILSDYPRERFTDRQLSALARAVERGSGLLMIGGWESYRGLAGNYDGTVVEEMLPVVMMRSDDRLNTHHPLVAVQRAGHPVLDGLDWQDPPAVGGLNRFSVRDGGRLLLSARELVISSGGGEVTFAFAAEHPLLVEGCFGKGRTMAFASDVAPHWIGGMVDWGKKRVRIRGAGVDVEIGSEYCRFWTRLIGYCGGTIIG